MSKDVLEQYSCIKKEIADLERRIAEGNKKIRQLEKEIVCDVVTGSRANLSIGKITVRGIAEGEIDKQWNRIRAYTDRLQHFKEKLKDMIVQIEDFIESIPSSEVRQMARLRFIDDLEYKGVAKEMGPGYTDDCCRQKLGRHLKKCGDNVSSNVPNC